MIFNSANILLYCVIPAVLVLAAILIYIYYRISSKNKAAEVNAESGADDGDEYDADGAELNILLSDMEQKGENTADDNVTENTCIEQCEYIEEAEDIGIEVLYTASNGETINVIEQDGCYVFQLADKEGNILGCSSPYQTKAGLQKSIKSFVNYKDTKVFDITITSNDFKITKFEIFADDNNTYSYNLKTKNAKIKFYGSGFKSKSDCLKAIDSVKNICENFNIN